MTLAPILAAPAVTQLHVAAALLALGIGGWQLWRPRPGPAHRRLGWLWAACMAAVAITSFWISHLSVVGPFSPIHGLSVLTLVALPVALLHARRGRVRAHRRTMTGLYVGGLVVAGAFTLAPGRILGRALLGW